MAGHIPLRICFASPRRGRLARNIAVALILVDVVLTAGLLSYRYRDRNTYALKTDRGTMIAVPDLGEAMDQAIAFIKRETAEGEPVAVMPEGTSLNFFTDRPNPLKRRNHDTRVILTAKAKSAPSDSSIESNTRLCW